MGEPLTGVAANRPHGFGRVWSNGVTEGQIHRLTLVKRQGYGRAGVAFLRQRVRLAV